MKILVIEDDGETAAYLVNALEAEGHLVEHVANGHDGLFQAVSGVYDVMIVDRMLPGLDGLGIVKAARAAGIRTPALFLSTLGGIDDRVSGLDAGGDDYLVKPFALAELLARVNALGRRPVDHRLSRSPSKAAPRPSAPSDVVACRRSAGNTPGW